MNHLNFAQEVNHRMEVLLREQGRLIGYVRRDNETAEGCRAYRGVFQGRKGRIKARWQVFELPAQEEE